jgi:hypothetical protein
MYNDFKDNHELFNNKVEPFDRLGEGQPKIKSYLTVTDPITGKTSEVEHINVPIADRLVQRVAWEDKFLADVASVKESNSFQQALKDIAAGNNVRYYKDGSYDYIGMNEKTGQYYMIRGQVGSDNAQIYIGVEGKGGKEFYSMNSAFTPETGLSGVVVATKESAMAPLDKYIPADERAKATSATTASGTEAESKGVSNEQLRALYQQMTSGGFDWQKMMSAMNGDTSYNDWFSMMFGGGEN